MTGAFSHVSILLFVVFFVFLSRYSEETMSSGNIYFHSHLPNLLDLFDRKTSSLFLYVWQTGKGTCWSATWGIWEVSERKRFRTFCAWFRSVCGRPAAVSSCCQFRSWLVMISHIFSFAWESQGGSIFKRLISISHSLMEFITFLPTHVTLDTTKV